MRMSTLIDYFMVVALVFVSGNIIFQNRVSLFSVFILATVLFFYRKVKFDMSFVYLLVGLTVIFILQTFKFDFFPAFTFAGVYVRILIAYFILKSVFDFPDKFVKVMYYISIMSFLFYIPSLLIPGFHELLVNKFILYGKGEDRFSIMGLYTIVPGYEHRNAGPFWEMGAFGGYLLFALIINYLKKQELVNKTNIILMLALLTTQSSTGYISFLFFLFFIFYSETKDVLIKIILTLSLLGIGYIAYSNLDFLGEKIERQLAEAKDLINIPNLEGASSDRFVSILKDWRDIQGHELIGRGPHDSTRFTTMYDTEKVLDIRTVGSTDMIARFGLPFFLWMLFLIYISFSTYSKHHWNNGNYMGVSIVILILLLLTSETYFQYPLFWIALMLQYTVDDVEDHDQEKEENKFYNL